MSDPAVAASPAAPAAPAPAAPASSTPAPAAAPAAPASAAPASPAPAATAAVAGATATPTAISADDARALLKAIVSDPDSLASKPDAEVIELATKAREKATAAAPEKYEPFTAPEGVTLDAGVVSEFETAAKELNLSQANAQALVNKLAPVIAKQQGEHINAQLAKADAEWLTASKADAEFGGEQFDANMVVAKNAIDSFATPAFKQFLNDSRLGNHPEWVRFAYRVGKAVSPDGKIVTGTEPGKGVNSLASKLWPASQT